MADPPIALHHVNVGPHDDRGPRGREGLGRRALQSDRALVVLLTPVHGYDDYIRLSPGRLDRGGRLGDLVDGIAIASPGREAVATHADASSVIWVKARKAIRTPLTVVIHGA